MDLFAQLDRHDVADNTPVAIAVRFRAKFHKSVIYKDLSLNPALSQEDIAAAVSSDALGVYLPRPWPPAALKNPEAIKAASLSKMAARTNFRNELPKTKAFAVASVIAERFPWQRAIPSTSGSIVSCEARIGVDGEVTIGTAFPKSPRIASNGESVTFTVLDDYIKSMLYLAIQQYSESL